MLKKILGDIQDSTRDDEKMEKRILTTFKDQPRLMERWRKKSWRHTKIEEG
jgi:hypothetical protein